MKKTVILIFISIALGITFTIFFLNKKELYAKEEYYVYAFQSGAYQEFDNASNVLDKLPSGIMLYEDGLYKVYVAMYKDIDLVNKMTTYFMNNNINVYIKTINVDKKFYNELNNYEILVKKTIDDSLYNRLNQSILNSYMEINNV